MFTNLMFTDAKIQENAHSPLKEFTFILANFTYFPFYLGKKCHFSFLFAFFAPFLLYLSPETYLSHENYTDRSHGICG